MFLRRKLCVEQVITGLSVLWFATYATVSAFGADWPLVRANVLGTGVAESGVPDKLDVLWTYRASEEASFDATAVVKDGVIYIGDSAGTLHAVRLDGKAVWTKPISELGFAAGAAVDGDRLYLGDLDGVVRSLSTSDGSVHWQYDMEGEVLAGPMLADGSLLITSEVGTLACLNAANGKERWAPFHIDAPLRCTPTIVTGHAMVAGCDSLLHVVKVDDGQETHTVPIDGPTGATPATLGERVFFGTEGGTFYAIDVPADFRKKPAVAWTYHDKRRAQPIRSAASVSKKLVTYGTQGKAIYGLNPETGDELWKVATRSRVESSPVIAGDRVVAATTAGKLYLIESSSGEIRYENEFGGGFVASPIVVDGRIIIGNTDGTLFCLGANEETSTDKQQTAHVEEALPPQVK